MRHVGWVLVPLVLGCQRESDDTGDTGDTGDTDTADTSDTSDSEDTETGDTDTGDTETGDTDTGDTETGDTDTGPLPSRFFNHSPTCASLSALRPGAGEDGHWAAVRLTPESYPFELTTVRFTLLHDPDATLSAVKCTSNQAYTMKLYVVSGTMPPDGTGSAPVPDDEWTFGVGALIGENVLQGDVDPPITLTTGEHVILAVNTYYTSADVRTCIKTCNTGTLTDPPRNYWSFAADPAAWDWAELSLAGTGIWAEGEGFPQ